MVGKCLLALERKQEGLATYQAAMAMSERLSDPILYTYSSKVGDLLLSMGKPAAAADAYDKSIDAFEQARAGLGGDDQDRMKFMDQHELDDFNAFDGMVRVQLALNRPDKAAEYLDRGRARCLLDDLERAERQSGGDLLSPIEAKAEKAHDARLLQEVSAAGTALAATDERVRQLTSQINYARSINSADADAQIDELQPKLREACGQYAAAHRRASISPARRRSPNRPRHSRFSRFSSRANTCSCTRLSTRWSSSSRRPGRRSRRDPHR